MDRIIYSKPIVFGLPVFIFLIDVFLTVYSQGMVELSSPIMHFAGGFSMALFFLHFYEKNLRLPGLFSIIAIAGFAVLIGVFWEFFEFGISVIFPGLPTQPSIADTMADLFLDLLGGLAIAFFYRNSKLYREFSLSK